METAPRTVYALLVGINDYRIPVNPLHGCEADVEQMRAWLERQADGELRVDIRVLLNEEASKAGVIAAFTEHLGQAGPDDVALFYFSGHGARERADPELWTNEADGYLEGLACANAPHELPPLLADKEMRWMIHRLGSQSEGGGPHVLILTDCCHSGDNSRGFLLDEEHPLAARQIDDILPVRAWEDFCFHDRIEPEQLRAASTLAEVLPEGPHLHLAACQDRQRAKEAYFAPSATYAGVFTTFLIEELDAAGPKLSYYELFRRLKLRTRYRYDQIVQLYVPGTQFNLPFRGFLNRDPQASGAQSHRVRFSPEKGWYIDRGALHGVSARQEAVPIATGDGEETVAAAIERVLPDQTLLRLSPEQEQQLDPDREYTATLGIFPSAPLAVYLRDDEGLEPEALEELRQRLSAGVANLNVLPHEGGADHTVQLIAGEYRITPALDPFRPVTQPIPMEDDLAIDRLLAYLGQIAQWTYLRDLESPPEDQVVFRGMYPVELIVEEKTSDGTWRPVEPSGGEFVVAYRQDPKAGPGNTDWTGEVRLAVQNHFSQTLYASLLYLQQDFSTVAKWGEQRMTFPLEPGQRLELFTGQLAYEPMLRDYNWPASLTHFTLLASTQENIDLADLMLEAGLPAPPAPNRDAPALGAAKGIKTNPEKDLALREGWITRAYTLRLPNPEYNQISRDRLQGLLNDETMREYAMGLYLDQDPASETMTLADGVTWLEREEGEKGLLWDTVLKVANGVATKLRRKDFKRRMRRYPHRTLMVSEGDSWFQHPTVRETIDHLSRFFNIYSVGLAGDEMREYFSTGKFVDALDDVERQYQRRPRILLLSGGGNDILGEQFREFLQPTLEPGADARTYLSDRFFEELEVITGLYTRVFERMANAWPDVDILTHGYDYVPATERKKGWVNPYLQERGLQDEADRARLIRFLIDTFNERLIAAGEPFSRVHHVDVRGIVKPYQWHDEIHPDREGYQEVAMQFMARIEELLRGDA